jgi:hypothetical protein
MKGPDVESQAAPQRRYSPPQLIVYGSVVTLTASGTGSSKENTATANTCQVNANRNPCTLP